jgi:glycosyltransferase involved in cell wall biosynthesis
MNTPQVSILTTTYNRADFLARAIESAQNQDYTNWELLILDDASSDNTKEIAAAYQESDNRIQYLPQQENVGIVKNRNTGLRAAAGEYVAILDSDDIWTAPNKLTQQVHFLDTHPRHVVIGTYITLIDQTGKKIGQDTYEVNDAGIREHLLVRNQFAHSSVMMRAAALHVLDGYSEKIELAEDYDLFLRLGERGQLANLPLFSTAYRVHAGSISKERQLDMAEALLFLIKQHKDHYPHYYQALFKALLRLGLIKTSLGKVLNI